MVAHDARNTGQSPYTGPEKPHVQWQSADYYESIALVLKIGKQIKRSLRTRAVEAHG